MSLRDDACFADLARNLKDHARAQPIVEIVNTGNWGDALIHAAQRELLRDAGVLVSEHVPAQSFKKLRKRRHWIKLLLRSLTHPRRAIITGGGAIREYYSRPSEFANAASQFSNVLLMPSSIPFLPDFDLKRTQLWRRDHLESKEGAPGARFCHDTAFYLRPSPRTPSEKLGILMRQDEERAADSVPPGNQDISALGTHLSDPEEFIDRVGRYEVILTNRLHVGIAGALLHREVHLFSSRTQKLRSVFEASLKPFYPKVSFHTDQDSVSLLINDANRAVYPAR